MPDAIKIGSHVVALSAINYVELNQINKDILVTPSGGEGSLHSQGGRYGPEEFTEFADAAIPGAPILERWDSIYGGDTPPSGTKIPAVKVCINIENVSSVTNMHTSTQVQFKDGTSIKLAKDSDLKLGMNVKATCA